MAIELYPETLEISAQFPKRKPGNILIKLVAEELGNTPTVCRSYYVHPLIFDKIEAADIPHPNPFRDSKTSTGLLASEKLLLDLLQK